jgi:hypothetical protein
MDVQDRKKEFQIGDMVELDDFPYVFFMRRISEEMEKMGLEGAYYRSSAFPLTDPKDWLMLIHLINEDYQDIINKKPTESENAALWLFERLDKAREKIGSTPVLRSLSKEVINQLSDILQKEAQKILEDKNKEIQKYTQNHTIVIEFSRGGPIQATLPLPYPYGYEHALPHLDKKILDSSKILYIQVSPEDSRRKNEERKDPDDLGSILHHYVPLTVMHTDYGCDDILYLKEHSDRPGYIIIEKDLQNHYIPISIMENHMDDTSVFRQNKANWNKKNILNFQKKLKLSLKELTESTN